MNPRADPSTVGQTTARATPTTRRGTPWQDRSPFDLWPAATATQAASSQGPPPAHTRHAISTREHQTGGAPTRTAPTRRAHPPRPPPNPTGRPTLTYRVTNRTRPCADTAAGAPRRDRAGH